jgi:hypothetical protein
MPVPTYLMKITVERWESNPARLKASKKFKYLIYILNIFGTI